MKEDTQRHIIVGILIAIMIALIAIAVIETHNRQNALCEMHDMTRVDNTCVSKDGKVFHIREERKIILVPAE